MVLPESLFSAQEALGIAYYFKFSSLRGPDRLKGTKILFKYGEERSIVCDFTYEEKKNFSGFTQNGCYGNQPHPFEALI